MANAIRSAARRTKRAERQGRQVTFQLAGMASFTPEHAAVWFVDDRRDNPLGLREAHADAWRGLTRRERHARRVRRSDAVWDALTLPSPSLYCAARDAALCGPFDGGAVDNQNHLGTKGVMHDPQRPTT